MSALELLRWAPEVHAGLCQMLEATPPGAVAVFDWDDTCIKGDISHELLSDIARNTGRDVWAPYLAQCESDRRAAYAQLTVTLVEGKTPEQVGAWTQEVFARSVASGRLAWSPEIHALYQAMFQRGWDVWVVTASPIDVVRTLAPHYGLPADRVLGMQPTMHASGRLCGPIQSPIPYRDGKLKLLRTQTSQPTFAAGDSESDRALLEAAKFQLFVDAGNTEMAEQAARQSWWRQAAWT